MKTIRHIALFALSALLFVGCEKMGDNDQVSGFWQLVSVQDGSTTTDVTADKIYWGLQDGIISVRSYNLSFAQYDDGEPCQELIGKYHIKSNNLIIDEFYEHYDCHDEVIKLISDTMKKYGIKTTNPIFSIHKPKYKLLLESQEINLTLIRL